jgi:hypothetical protein
VSAGIPALALEFDDAASGRSVWREPLAAHSAERLIAAAQLIGVAAGMLPNDGRPMRLDVFAPLDRDRATLRVTLSAGAGATTFTKDFRPARAFQDDAEALLARLLAAKTVSPGTYHFRLVPAAEPPAPPALHAAPLPRRLPTLARRSLWRLGLTAMPRCGHQTIVIPRNVGTRLLEMARADATVEAGAMLVAEPFLPEEPVPCRWAILVREAVALAEGTTGTETQLRVTPHALAAVPIDEERGRWAGGLAHSHPFGDKTVPHFLSSDDKAVATQWFWRPFCIQLVIDPRFAAPEEALAAYCWQDGALARVCFTLIDAVSEEDPCPP